MRVKIFVQYVKKHAEGDTIECEECDDWLHFECVRLTKAQVHKIDSDIPYICKQCIDDHLYQLPKDIDETIVLETKQKNKTRAKSNCHSPVSTGFSELYWSYKWHSKPY